MTQIAQPARPLAASAETTLAGGPARVAPVIGRVLMAAIYLMSGIGKAAAPAGTLAYIEAAGLPLPQAAFAVAVIVEIGGGLLLVAGWHARLVALVLAAFTLATAFGFHAHFGDQNQTIHFLKNLAMTGGLLQVAGFGAGAFSLDARRRRA